MIQLVGVIELLDCQFISFFQSVNIVLMHVTLQLCVRDILDEFLSVTSDMTPQGGQSDGAKATAPFSFAYSLLRVAV